jgi:pSer/pThr/pTyr-binding forkhead associated (FHA) protein
MYASNYSPIRLIALDGRFDIDLGRGLVLIGRHPQCDIRLDSNQVSRRHCCLTEADGEVRVCDLGSTNGIRINGRRVQSGRLKPGDELMIANFRYFVDIPATEASVA